MTTRVTPAFFHGGEPRRVLQALGMIVDGRYPLWRALRGVREQSGSAPDGAPLSAFAVTRHWLADRLAHHLRRRGLGRRAADIGRRSRLADLRGALRRH